MTELQAGKEIQKVKGTLTTGEGKTKEEKPYLKLYVAGIQCNVFGGRDKESNERYAEIYKEAQELEGTNVVLEYTKTAKGYTDFVSLAKVSPSPAEGGKEDFPNADRMTKQDWYEKEKREGKIKILLGLIEKTTFPFNIDDLYFPLELAKQLSAWVYNEIYIKELDKTEPPPAKPDSPTVDVARTIPTLKKGKATLISDKTEVGKLAKRKGITTIEQLLEILEVDSLGKVGKEFALKKISELPDIP